MSKILYHTDVEVVHDLNDGLLYTFPPNEPVEVKDDYIASKILEHKVYHGLVEVKQIQTRSGVKYDLDAAQKAAEIALKEADKKVLDEYVKSQLEDRIRKNYPPVPPTGRYKYVVDKYRIDLRKYGINLIGPDAIENAPTIQTMTSPDVQILMNENAELRSKIEKFMGMVERGELMAAPRPAVPVPSEVTIEEQEQEQEEEPVAEEQEPLSIDESDFEIAEADAIPPPAPSTRRRR